MSLNTSLEFRLRATLITALDLVNVSAPLDFQFTDQLGSGVVADMADRVWSDTRTLAASATEDLDFSGSLTQPDGSAFVLVKLKALLITAAAGNTNDVQVIRPAANGVPIFATASDQHNIKPGGMLFMYSPTLAGICAVTAGTGDLITITNSGAGTSVTYSIVAIGVSA